MHVGNTVWATGVAAVGPGGGQHARQQRGVVLQSTLTHFGMCRGGGGHEETWA